MKTPVYNLLSFLLLTLLMGCQRDDPKTEIPDFSQFQPQVTDKGTPDGAPVTKVIGVSGGEVVSADGLLTLGIPAGALSTNTSISIQPITNHVPLGVGKGYRLTPEGTTFSKPVKISFKYNDEILDSGIPEVLWIATQKEDGTWLGDRRSKVDKNAKTVTTETTHFSDWVTGRFINFELVSDKQTVKTGESVELELTGFLLKDEGYDLVPLIYTGSGSKSKVPVDKFAVAEEYNQFYIGDWALNGKKIPVSNSNGSLDSYKGLYADYTAPAKPPSPRTVAVSLTLNFDKNSGGKGSVILVTHITIVDDGYYFRLMAGGKEYLFTGFNLTTPISEQEDRTAYPAFIQKGTLLLSGSTKSLSKSSAGTFLFTLPGTSTGSYRPEYDKHPAIFTPDNFRGDISGDLNPSYVNENISYERDSHGGCILKSRTTAGLTFRITRFGNPQAPKEEDRVVEGTFMGQMGELTPLLQINCRNTNNKINVSGDFRLLLMQP